MLKKIILFLIRKKLGVGKEEWFKFVGQKTNDIYHFTNDGLYKIDKGGKYTRSGVSLNWLIDENCEVRPYNNLTIW